MHNLGGHSAQGEAAGINASPCDKVKLDTCRQRRCSVDKSDAAVAIGDGTWDAHYLLVICTPRSAPASYTDECSEVTLFTGVIGYFLRYL